MSDLSSLLFGYVTQLDFFNFFVQLFNFYFPFGSFFWLVGVVLFVVTELKTKSITYATMPTTIWFVIVSNISYNGVYLVVNAYARMAMNYVGLVLTIILGLQLWTLIKGR
jgi:hypothetical protein